MAKYTVNVSGWQAVTADVVIEADSLQQAEHEVEVQAKLGMIEWQIDHGQDIMDAQASGRLADETDKTS